MEFGWLEPGAPVFLPITFADQLFRLELAAHLLDGFKAEANERLKP